MTEPVAKRILFVIRDLPRPLVSVRGLLTGHEAMSGTHSSTLLVADGLAKRGWEVAMLTTDGSQACDTGVIPFHEFKSARSWLGKGRAIWSYHGDDGIMENVTRSGVKPIVWSHVDPTSELSRWLHNESITGVVAVSDFCRLALLHHSKYRRIGRIYNPLNPFFADGTATPEQNPKNIRQAVFAGYVGRSKGAHRVFECWCHVKRALPDAQLVVAGSGKLYRKEASLGAFGVADQEFEKSYISPLANEFGSLESAGVRLAGLLSPADLRSLYRQSTLGIINLNFDGSGETFSCSGVEMAASGLKVFSVASGALPETIGFTGDACLVERRDGVAPALIDALRQQNDPETHAARRRKVLERYRLSHILDQWEALLPAKPDLFYDLAGPWQFNRSSKYFIKKTLGRFRAGGVLDRCLELRRYITRS